jgi:hypothetical protein
LALLATLAAGCTVQRTSTTSETQNCSIGGCDTTRHSTPAPGPAFGALLLGCAALARRTARGPANR